ncbi:hypothetical protein C3F09_06745 [candidate division GN15 bacterium]|uniref:Outer membrane protein beta-barrel domain-containing protein n=1 Tax=candidate division GN15 bacterium TaxID=2072418 RepID=A0A855X5Y0_9BACT|nr:MAG: hypothetical protein C3F09_06745 [candidate division GN15 bacterium]
MKKLTYIMITIGIVSLLASSAIRAQAEFLKGNAWGIGALYEINSEKGNLAHSLGAGISILGRANVGATATRVHGGEDPTLAFFVEGFLLKQGKSDRLMNSDGLDDRRTGSPLNFGIGVSLSTLEGKSYAGLGMQLSRRQDLSQFVFLQPAINLAFGGIGNKTTTTAVAARLNLGVGSDKEHVWWLFGIGTSANKVTQEGWSGYSYGEWHYTIDFSLGLVIPFNSAAD